MQRLTGIGVSPGVVVGRAVILIQRTQVLRYPDPAGARRHELARLEGEPRAVAPAADRHPRARRRAARAELARCSTRSC